MKRKRRRRKRARRAAAARQRPQRHLAWSVMARSPTTGPPTRSRSAPTAKVALNRETNKNRRKSAPVSHNSRSTVPQSRTRAAEPGTSSQSKKQSTVKPGALSHYQTQRPVQPGTKVTRTSQSTARTRGASPAKPNALTRGKAKLNIAPPGTKTQKAATPRSLTPPQKASTQSTLRVRGIPIRSASAGQSQAFVLPGNRNFATTSATRNRSTTPSSVNTRHAVVAQTGPSTGGNQKTIRSTTRKKSDSKIPAPIQLPVDISPQPSTHPTAFSRGTQKRGGPDMQARSKSREAVKSAPAGRKSPGPSSAPTRASSTSKTSAPTKTSIVASALKSTALRHPRK